MAEETNPLKIRDRYLIQTICGNEEYEGDQENIDLDDFNVVETTRPREENRYVIHWLSANRYYEVLVPYSSWEGTYWYDYEIHEVEPVEVVVTQYRRKK